MLYEYENGSAKVRAIVDNAMAIVINHIDIPDNVNVTFEFAKSNSCGGCVDMEVDEDGVHQFYVDLNSKQSAEELTATVFHELKHVEQNANRRLDQTIWLGKDYKDVQYADRPWEIEAYAFEEQMMGLYRGKYETYCRC